MPSAICSDESERKLRLPQNYHLMRDALARLDHLKQQPQRPILRVAQDPTPILRTFPTLEALLRIVKLMPDEEFLAVSLPTDFLTWIRDLDNWRIARLTGKERPGKKLDKTILVTAVEFGKSQLCGVAATKNVYHGVCPQFEHADKLVGFPLFRGNLGENATFPDDMISHSLTGFFALELDPAHISPEAAAKLGYPCGRCGNTRICMCIFFPVLHAIRIERMWMQRDDCALRTLVPHITQGQAQDTPKINEDCLCLEDYDEPWTQVFECAHVFHRHCLIEWLFQKLFEVWRSTCQLCRKELANRELAHYAEKYLQGAAYYYSSRREEDESRLFFAKQQEDPESVPDRQFVLDTDLNEQPGILGGKPPGSQEAERTLDLD